MRRFLIFLCILACGLAIAAPPNGLTNRSVAWIATRAGSGAGTGGSAGITFDSASTASGANSPANPKHESITIGNLTNGYAVCWVALEGNHVTGIDFDGGAMTLLKDQNNGTDAAHVYVYGLAVGNKTSGIYDFVVQFDTTPSYYTAGGVAFKGVHQTVSTGTAAGASGTSTTPTVNATSATGELVIGAVLSDDDGTITVGAGQTERNKFVGAVGIGGAFSDEAGAATTTHSYTKGTSGMWIIVAVPLKPAP